MKIGDIKNIKIAKKYSNALISASQEVGLESKVYEDLVFVLETINSNDNLNNALLNPVVNITDKKDIVIKLFSPHIEKITLDFIVLLLENNRVNALSEIINQYLNSYNEINNIVKPRVISAIELDENQKTRIVEKLEKKLSKTVHPDYLVDEEIIGGLIIEIADKTIDCSLKTKFDTMKKQLTKGNRYGDN